VPTIACRASRPGISPAREAQEYLTPYDHLRGDPHQAVVFLVVYSDFQCTSCAALAPVLRHVWQAHAQDVAVVFRHFPLLNVHDKAALAAQAAEAAALQGKFWEMHDLLFAEQSRWVGMDGKTFQAYLQAAAERVGLDAHRFQHDLQSQPIHDRIQRAWENGVTHRLPAVPMVYINAHLYAGPLDFHDLDTVVRLKILEAHQFHVCPPKRIASDASVEAEVLTTRGTITLRLFPRQAPNAVNSFAFLAAHGWYDGNPVLEATDALVRTGDPSGTGYGNAGYTFGLEIAPRLKFERPGIVALYNAGGATNSAQFFITRRALPRDDGHATIFGEVVAGMGIVRQMAVGDHILQVKIRLNGAPWPWP
jgi:cyclophilin family peptidyl-prolyl cis-trans isomerase/predicted DsbA family dithiol-disulfide isomerase